MTTTTTTTAACDGCGSPLTRLDDGRWYRDLGPGTFTIGGQTGSDGHCYVGHDPGACTVSTTVHP